MNIPAMIQQSRMARLQSWAVGMRICVPGDEDDLTPLWATIVSIDSDYQGFTVEWDHTGFLGWQSIEDIACFQSEFQA